MYFTADRYKDALPLTMQNVQEIRDSGRAGTLTELVAIFNYAGTLSRLGEFVEAVAVLRDQMEAVGPGDPGGFWPIGMKAYYGVWLQRLGKNSEALAFAEADLLLAQRDGNSGVMATCHLLASRALLALQGVDAARQRLNGSEQVWSAVAERQPRLLREVELQRTEIQLAENDLPAAKVSIDAALAESGYPAHKNASALERLLRTASVIYLRIGDADAARTFASDALAISSKLARSDRRSADVGLAALLRAEALFFEGDLRGAIADADLATEALTNGYGVDHPDTLRSQRLLDSLGVSVSMPDRANTTNE
jgi:tetratricopeptide (TPR) repeat protein